MTGMMETIPVRVLIVDDELPIRILLARMLKTWGYQVWHVGSAQEAIGAMAAAPADIVLCDVRMPDRDGLWLAREIQDRWPHARLIMTTGAHEPDVIQASRRLGAIAYVTKPFVAYHLREALETATLQYRGAVRSDRGPAQLAR